MSEMDLPQKGIPLNDNMQKVIEQISEKYGVESPL
jgi:hypothetical protein